MPKTRLNQERRYALTTLARAFCETLELEPKELEDIENACKRRDAAHAKMATLAYAAASAHYKPADMAVLRKFGLTQKLPSATFVNLDNSADVFEIEFIDEKAMLRGVDSLQREDREKLREDVAKAKEAKRLELPAPAYDAEWGGYRSNRRQQNHIPCGAVLATLRADWQSARTDEKLAREALHQRRSKLYNSLTTLIDQSRYYEDVVAVWPHAETLRERIVPSQTALSVLSDDALAAIKEAQQAYDASRTIQIDAPPDQKALPAPTVDATATVIDAEVIDVTPVAAAS